MGPPDTKPGVAGNSQREAPPIMIVWRRLTSVARCMCSNRRLLASLFLLLGLVDCRNMQAKVVEEVHDQGIYTIALPPNWRAGGSGGHSFYQSDSSGCFTVIDRNNDESLARLCSSAQPWENVAARAAQVIDQYGPGLEHEKLSTPGGAVYHLLRDKGQVVRILLEGPEHLLHIALEAPNNPEVAPQMIARLDQVVWRPVPAEQRRLKLSATQSSAASQSEQQNNKGKEAVFMLCQGSVFDTDLLVTAMQQQLDLATTCPNQQRTLIEMLAFVPDAHWLRVLSLVTGQQRQDLLNLRLGVMTARLANGGPEDGLLEQIGALALAGARPVDLHGKLAPSVLSALLSWPHGAVVDAPTTDRAIAVLLQLFENLAAIDRTPPQLGNQFWHLLLTGDPMQAALQEPRQLRILQRLHQRFGTVAPTRQGEMTPLQRALSNASPAVVQAVGQLTPSDAPNAGMLSAAIERDRWQLLAGLRPIELNRLEQSEYRSVLVTATRKMLATGEAHHLHRLLSLRKADPSTLDWLLHVVLHAYDDEFAAFGWKTVEFLQQNGASAERVLANPRNEADNPCNFMLGSPERFRGLVARGLPVQTPLPVLGQPGLKVDALSLFFMCRDPRSSVAINEDLGEFLVRQAQPQDFNTYHAATKAFPLALAAKRSLKLARLMIERGADVNAQDAHGNTVLMMEAASNEPATIRFLLEAGAEVDRTNKLGINALGYAQCFDAKEAIGVLSLHSAKAEGTAGCRAAVAPSPTRRKQQSGSDK